MQVRCEETISVPEGAEGKLIAEVAAMELSENREVDVKQGKEEEEEMKRCRKERMHHRHHGHGHPLLRRHHGHRPHPHPHHHVPHPHPHHHGPHPHPQHQGLHPHPRHHGHHPHLHHKEKIWEKLEKKKGREGWNSKFIGKMNHKLEKINWKIESLQEKKLFILRKIQETEEEEEKKKKETALPTDAA